MENDASHFKLSERGPELVDNVLFSLESDGIDSKKFECTLGSDASTNRLMSEMSSVSVSLAPDEMFCETFETLARQMDVSDTTATAIASLVQMNLRLVEVEKQANRSIVKIKSTLQALVKNQSPMDAKHVLDKATKKFDKEKYKKKGTLAIRSVNLEQQQRVLQEATLDYSVAIQSVRGNREVEMIRGLASLYESLIFAVEESANVIQQTKPDFKSLYASLNEEKVTLESVVPTLTNYKATLKQKRVKATSLEAEMEKEEKLARKMKKNRPDGSAIRNSISTSSIRNSMPNVESEIYGRLPRVTLDGVTTPLQSSPSMSPKLPRVTNGLFHDTNVNRPLPTPPIVYDVPVDAVRYNSKEADEPFYDQLSTETMSSLRNNVPDPSLTIPEHPTSETVLTSTNANTTNNNSITDNTSSNTSNTSNNNNNNANNNNNNVNNTNNNNNNSNNSSSSTTTTTATTTHNAKRNSDTSYNNNTTPRISLPRARSQSLSLSVLSKDTPSGSKRIPSRKAPSPPKNLLGDPHFQHNHHNHLQQQHLLQCQQRERSHSGGTPPSAPKFLRLSTGIEATIPPERPPPPQTRTSILLTRMSSTTETDTDTDLNTNTTTNMNTNTNTNTNTNPTATGYVNANVNTHSNTNTNANTTTNTTGYVNTNTNTLSLGRPHISGDSLDAENFVLPPPPSVNTDNNDNFNANTTTATTTNNSNSDNHNHHQQDNNTYNNNNDRNSNNNNNNNSNNTASISDNVVAPPVKPMRAKEKEKEKEKEKKQANKHETWSTDTPLRKESRDWKKKLVPPRPPSSDDDDDDDDDDVDVDADDDGSARGVGVGSVAIDEQTEEEGIYQTVTGAGPQTSHTEDDEPLYSDGSRLGECAECNSKGVMGKPDPNEGHAFFCLSCWQAYAVGSHAIYSDPQDNTQNNTQNSIYSDPQDALGVTTTNNNNNNTTNNTNTTDNNTNNNNSTNNNNNTSTTASPTTPTPTALTATPTSTGTTATLLYSSSSSSSSSSATTTKNPYINLQTQVAPTVRKRSPQPAARPHVGSSRGSVGGGGSGGGSGGGDGTQNRLSAVIRSLPAPSPQLLEGHDVLNNNNNNTNTTTNNTNNNNNSSNTTANNATTATTDHDDDTSNYDTIASATARSVAHFVTGDDNYETAHAIVYNANNNVNTNANTNVNTTTSNVNVYHDSTMLPNNTTTTTTTNANNANNNRNENNVTNPHTSNNNNDEFANFGGDYEDESDEEL